MAGHSSAGVAGGLEKRGRAGAGAAGSVRAAAPCVVRAPVAFRGSRSRHSPPRTARFLYLFTFFPQALTSDPRLSEFTELRAWEPESRRRRTSKNRKGGLSTEVRYSACVATTRRVKPVDLATLPRQSARCDIQKRESGEGRGSGSSVCPSACSVRRIIL